MSCAKYWQALLDFLRWTAPDHILFLQDQPGMPREGSITARQRETTREGFVDQRES